MAEMYNARHKKKIHTRTHNKHVFVLAFFDSQ